MASFQREDISLASSFDPDLLAQAISLLRPRALLWKHVEARGDWALTFPQRAGMTFCLMVSGRCHLRIAEEDSIDLNSGDFVLLPAAVCWTLSHAGSLDNERFASICGLPERRVRVAGSGKPQAAAQFFGGRFEFDSANQDLVHILLPRRITVRSSEPGAGRLGSVLKLLDDEALSERPGRTLLLQRLLEMMLIECLRNQALRPGQDGRTLLAGLADPYVGTVLRCMHSDIRRVWTVAELAKTAGMSRTVFAERFSRILGMSPMEYILYWRMAIAKDRLRFERANLSEVALDCGYKSVSGFSTAFRRVVGCSPAQFGAGLAEANTRSQCRPAPHSARDLSQRFQHLAARERKIQS